MIQWFLVYSQGCKNHHNFRTFLFFQKETPCPLTVIPILLSPSPRKSIIYFLSLQIYQFCTFYINGNHTTCNLLWLFFSRYHVFKVHLCCNTYLYFIFYCQVIFHCTDIPLFYLSLHSSVDGQLCCFHLLTIINNAAMNVHVQDFVRTYVFISFFIYSYSQQWNIRFIWYVFLMI